jgi:hypothetical protein
MSASFSGNKFCKRKNGLLCNFKMIGTLNVNLSKRWGEIKDMWEG